MKDSALIAPPVPKAQFPSLRFMTLASNARMSRAPESGNSCQFFWARNALYHCLPALGISRGAHVLLPAYLCRAAVEPFEAFGAEIEFYGVGRDCHPDFSEIESRITPRTEAILAVHYFGYSQKISEFRAICDRHRLALIEDCAHVLQNRSDGPCLGSFGDASVFSGRKFLPTYDGGELWLKRSSDMCNVDWKPESVLFTLKVAKSLLDQSLENSSSPLAKAAFAILKSLSAFAKRMRNSGKASGDAPLFALDSDVADFDPSLLNQPMSRLSTWLQKHSDVAAIIACRRQNFQYLHDELQSMSRVTLLHTELPEHGSPWVLPAFINGVADAHLKLQELGVPAVNWAGVRPPALPRGAFPDVDFLYDNLVFLPIHQNLTPSALQAIVEAVRKIQANPAGHASSPRLVGTAAPL